MECSQMTRVVLIERAHGTMQEKPSPSRCASYAIRFSSNRAATQTTRHALDPFLCINSC